MSRAGSALLPERGAGVSGEVRPFAVENEHVTGAHQAVADLRERMARLEGLFEGFTRRESHAAPPAGNGWRQGTTRPLAQTLGMPLP